MNKSTLIERIAVEVAISKKDAEKTLNVLISVVISELQIGNDVIVTGFGTFSSKTRHARGGVNPQNPTERIQIPEVTVAKFKTGKKLKDALKNK